MAECRWTKTSLFLILLLQFTAAATGPYVSFSTVRVGDEVTLPCHIPSQTCDSLKWIFTDSRRTATVDLVRDGRIVEKAKAKSDRLSVTENCSLVIKKVTEEDAGHYGCEQFRSQQLAPDTVVILSVVTMTEHQDSDEVTLRCSVSTYGPCSHTVKWLFKSHDVDKDNPDMRTSQSPCCSSVTFPTSHFSYTSRYQLFRCEVTEGDKVQEFPFSPQSSGGDTIKTKPTTTESDVTSGTNDASPKPQGSWRSIFGPVGLAALIIIVVAVNMWTRAKEKKTQTEDIAVRYDVDDDTVNYENIRSPDGV
ncbi:uncharacterized protein LOC116706130 [Etheostoma spectabile]|uniref:uncharacterized protein LOC116706130 n=1 Tax=Etheostoma spectabile TaxID=54343 RepID=UPI0013AF8633|nr:uncharacterized protein LOC116706130 [Etheostoma spectabile]